MSSLVEKLEGALAEALTELADTTTVDAAEDIRIKYLGRKGFLPAAMKEMGALSAEERPEVGKIANRVKTALTDAIDGRLNDLRSQDLDGEPIDVTAPGRRVAVGHKHPLSTVIDECVEIFRRLGFVVAQGPELEDEYHNFDALNTPADHPSRDQQDTLFLFDGRLLRTQTSTVQIRVMEQQEPPVRIVAPGRCYRRDTPDQTHSMTFHQIEGLYVDKNVSLADLKGTLHAFAMELFGKDVKYRLRPHFFPFTEPSLELDVWYTGGGTPRWLEIAGAGMVDPNVLKAVGYDPEIYTGFAFGMGIERMAMIRYQIPDIRMFYENDVRFLKQF